MACKKIGGDIFEPTTWHSALRETQHKAEKLSVIAALYEVMVAIGRQERWLHSVTVHRLLRQRLTV